LRRFYNHGNLIENNLIYDIGRIGIFVGNEEKSTIRGNRIHGITGQIADVNGVRQDATADCAGIKIGGMENSIGMDGFAAFEMEVYKNEISNISSQKSITGIKYEQSMIRDQITGIGIRFPDAYERSRIYSNIIWGFLPSSSTVDRYGIHLSISKRQQITSGDSWKASDTLFYSTADSSYNIERMLIANNTILMEEDNFYSSGDYIGLYLQKLRNSRVLNNAIEMADTTQSYSERSLKFASAIFYQSPEPELANNQIDYNVYYTRPGSSSIIDIYRYVNTDVSGIILDLGYRGEYSTLSQWQNWMRTDVFSTIKGFSHHFEKTNERYPRFRMRTNPLPINNPLEKRGTYLTEAGTDIDGKDRNTADQRYDIGAQLLEGRRFITDIEILNIYEPATYKANIGPFRDAEYFMIDNKPITVKVLVRNNGNNPVSNKNLTLRVYRETATVNNANANRFNTEFNDTYYNNERGLYL